MALARKHQPAGALDRGAHRRTPRPRSRAAARSRTSSSPPTPTASSPPCGCACSPTWAPTSSSSRRASRCSGRSSTPASTTCPRPTSSRCTGVFTTMTPTDAYRGAGRPEATYAIERAMDALAARSGIDPLELRRRNYIAKEQFPYTACTGLVYDSGDHDAAPTKALELVGYDELREPSSRRRTSPVPPSTWASAISSLLRDVRPGPVPGAGLAELLRRRLGGGHRAGAADRQGPGRHRRRAARPGPRDVLVDDRRRQARRRPRRRRGAALRHRDQPRSGSTPTARARWPSAASPSRMACDKVIDKARADRRPPAGGGRGGPRVRRRARSRCGARPTSRCRWRRSPSRRSPPTTCPTGWSPTSRPGHLRPAELLVAVRHPHLRRRGRRGDRRRRRAQVRRRRRLRQPDQPADRRRPGARRRHPGPRPGALRGGRLRRRRQPRRRARWPTTSCRRPATSRRSHRPHRHAAPDQPARRQGHRRGRHDRRRRRR